MLAKMNHYKLVKLGKKLARNVTQKSHPLLGPG